MSKAVRRASLPAAIVLTIAAILTVAFVTINGPNQALARPGGGTPTRSQIAAALYRVGLSPEALAAAGVGESGAAAVIAAMSSHLSENATAIADADAAYASAVASADALERLVQAGKASEGDVSALVTARQTLASASASRASAESAAFTAAAASLSANQRTLLQAIQSGLRAPGGAGEEAGLSLRAVTRTPVEWAALREALALERIALANNEEVPGAAAALLADARSHITASALASNLTNNLATVQASWSAAMANYPTGG